MSEAAYTEPSGTNPAYINAQRETLTVTAPIHDEIEVITVSVRTAGEASPSTIKMPVDEFQQWLADATRIVQNG